MTEAICPLCEFWNRTPHSSRPTSPVSAQEAEQALVVGYWICTRGNRLLCQRHGEAVIRLEQAQLILENPPKVDISTVAQELRNQYVERLRVLGKVPCSDCNALLDTLDQEHGCPAKKPPMVQMEIKNQGGQIQMIPPLVVPVKIEPTKQQFPCPFCKKLTFSGDVHVCSDEPEISGIAEQIINSNEKETGV